MDVGGVHSLVLKQLFVGLVIGSSNRVEEKCQKIMKWEAYSTKYAHAQGNGGISTTIALRGLQFHQF